MNQGDPDGLGQDARRLDESGLALSAIEAYEIALSADRLTREEVIDLAFLYGLCWDFGFATAYGISSETVRSIWDRFQRLLSWAQTALGDWDDLRFVAVYLPWAFLGIGDTDEVEAEMERLMRKGDTLLPVVFLWSSSKPSEYGAARAALFRQVATHRSARADYVRSVLKATQLPNGE